MAAPQPPSLALVDLRTLFDLTGKVAIVTGSAEGMGKEIARYLASAGAAVVVADRNAQGAAATAAELTDAGANAVSLAYDQSSETSIVDMVSAARTTLGPIHILVNNAAIQDRALLGEITGAYWDRIMAVNLRGPFLCLQAVAEKMKADKIKGRIVNISSMGSELSISDGLLAYAATKSGLNAVTRNASFELAPHGITVNAILPGPVPTRGSTSSSGPPLSEKMMQRLPPPIGRFGEPGDIAALALYLASNAAGFLTGQLILIDGGFKNG